MNNTMRTLAAAALLSAAIVGATWQPLPVQACGIMARPSMSPSIALERVLIVHDGETQTEHFIREIAFRDADEPFGFVVPTPTRPTVAEFASPFDKLNVHFRFQPPEQTARLGAVGFGGGVQVLEKKDLGSFTGYVLAAQDEQALAKWLNDHQLTSSSEAKSWLGHYVRMDFYYVAMRYNPQKQTGADALADSRAETVRITFKTPLPYYPYLEPALPPNTTSEKRRALQLWLATDRPALPVAARTRDGRTAWVRPMREGANFEDARATLLKALPDAPVLLPAGRLTVQTFQDQKRSRSGFGDMLFLPKKKRMLSAAQRDAAAKLMAVLDPTLATDR